LVCGGVCALSAAAAGQQAPPKSAAPPASPPAPAAQPQVAMPGAEQIVILIRTALLTLNDAVRTGNFTVLRDTAAPAFREANNAAKLAQIFSQLMRDRVDLSGVATASPQLAQAPSIDPKTGMLGIDGVFQFPTWSLTFSVAYQSVGGRWRLFGISAQPGAPAKQAPPVRKAPVPPASK
jgi:hypothetical protein